MNSIDLLIFIVLDKLWEFVLFDFLVIVVEDQIYTRKIEFNVRKKKHSLVYHCKALVDEYSFSKRSIFSSSIILSLYWYFNNSINSFLSSSVDFNFNKQLIRTWKKRNFPLISLVDWPPTKNILIANGSSILLSSSILWNNSLISTKTPLIYLKFKKKTIFLSIENLFLYILSNMLNSILHWIVYSYNKYKSIWFDEYYEWLVRFVFRNYHWQLKLIDLYPMFVRYIHDIV